MTMCDGFLYCLFSSPLSTIFAQTHMLKDRIDFETWGLSRSHSSFPPAVWFTPGPKQGQDGGIHC